MYPSQHLFLGTLFAAIFFLIFPQIELFGFSLIILSTFFIDADHYLFYVWKKRGWNLKKAHAWFGEEIKKKEKLAEGQIKKYKYDLLIFHGIEFLAILAVLSFANIFFWYLLLGVAFHMVLDWAAPTYKKEPVDYKISQIYNLARNRNKKDLL